jgi:SMC interacting uncharacterized protein involved in chromosome segregation
MVESMNKTEKRIRELQENIGLINELMESMSRKRGEYFIELAQLEVQQIEKETELDVLTVGP